MHWLYWLYIYTRPASDDGQCVEVWPYEVDMHKGEWTGKKWGMKNARILWMSFMDGPQLDVAPKKRIVQSNAGLICSWVSHIILTGKSHAFKIYLSVRASTRRWTNDTMQSQMSQCGIISYWKAPMATLIQSQTSKQTAITDNNYKSSFKISSEVSHIELLIQTYQLV